MEGAGCTSSVGSDGAQLDGQGVARLPEVLHSVVVAPAAVEVAPATQDGAIREVEPQVLPHVALGALPATDPGEENEPSTGQRFTGVVDGQTGLCSFSPGPRPLSSPLLGTSPPRVQLLMSLPPYSAPEPLSLQTPRRVTTRPCSAGHAPRLGGRGQASPGRDPSRVVQLLEVEGMLRDLSHFPIPGLHLLLAGG